MSKKNDKDIYSQSSPDNTVEIIPENPETDLSAVKLKKSAKRKKKSKFKKWVKRHKVITVIISIVLVLAILLGIFFAVRSAKSTEASYSFIRTTTLSKGNLDDSISATGTVESAETSNVTTSLNYTIKTVNVAVGDEVKEGDIICTLDTSDLESQIEKEQENVTRSVSQAQTSYDSAKENYDKAVTTLNDYKSELSDAKAEKASAYTPYKTAKSAVSSALSAYNKALTAYNKAGSAYVTALNKYNSALSSYKNGNSTKSALYKAAENYMTATQNLYGGCIAGSYSTSESSASTSSSGSSLSGNSSNSGNSANATQSANNASSGSSSSVTVTETADSLCNKVVASVKNLTGKTLTYSKGTNTLYKLNQKSTALQSAKSASNYTSLEEAYNTANSAYEQAKQTYEQYEDAVTQARSQLTQASSELENASSSDTLTELTSQLEECTLKAGQDGTVTALNATVGSASSGQQAVATVQNLDDLKISITIEEADINNAKTGMSCYITSDAVEDTLNGTLTQIDPTASENGSFGAEVTVDSKASGLLIGMNASVQIIVSSSEDVFQVPIDALGDDEDGKGSYVYRQTGGEGTDMTFEKIYVTTGEENDYYVEIESDDLAEGDVIRSNSDLSEGIETVSSGSDSDSSSGFDLSSIFGGSGGMERGNKANMGSGFSGGSATPNSANSGSAPEPGAAPDGGR